MAEVDTKMRDAALHVSDVKDASFKPLPYKPVSADSHITEPPNTYSDYIDPKFRDVAPKVIKGPTGGDVFVIPGMEMQIPMGGMAAAGRDPREMRMDTATFDEIHRSAWDGKARVADQDLDGVAGEIIYPTVGMLLCNHPDKDYKNACFHAYNRWLQEYQSAAPDRIYGIGQTAVRSPKEAVEDFRRIKEMGFWGVMLPNEPASDVDYDHPSFDELWQASIDLELPLSFHILTSKRDAGAGVGVTADQRGQSKAHQFHNLIRANQDIISLFIWEKIFERFPKLKMVCVEADAGWAPHFMYRMDHYYNRHRFWAKIGEMSKMPSEYFRENVYLTFQDDFVAFNSTNMLNTDRLMWANDFPHSDSTWPWSQQMLGRHTEGLTDEVRKRILRDNVIELYNLPAK